MKGLVGAGLKIRESETFLITLEEGDEIPRNGWYG